MKDLKKNIVAGYWTIIEVNGNQVAVRFRFPMAFGMLRAADWAEKEIQDAADRLAEWQDEGDRTRNGMKGQLRYMMPLRKGHRKLLHRTRRMELTLGGGSFEIGMTVDVKGDGSTADERMRAADQMDDAIEEMAAWMRENAYAMLLQ